jgi:hypothetical protein
MLAIYFIPIGLSWCLRVRIDQDSDTLLFYFKTRMDHPLVRRSLIVLVLLPFCWKSKHLYFKTRMDHPLVRRSLLLLLVQLQFC